MCHAVNQTSASQAPTLSVVFPAFNEEKWIGRSVEAALAAAAQAGIATVSASRIGQRKIRSLTIQELERSIELDLSRKGVTIYRHISHDSGSDGRGHRRQTMIKVSELVTAREPLATQLARFLDLIDGKIDLDEERTSILPYHRAVAAARSQSVAAVAG
jgi:hypothetical protein